MKGFARQWLEPQFQFSLILFLLLLHLGGLISAVVGISTHSWIAAVSSGAGAFVFLSTFLYVAYWGSTRYGPNFRHKNNRHWRFFLPRVSS